MHEKDRESLLRMGEATKIWAATYRRAAASFGLSECGMWILYYLLAVESDLTQRNLTDILWFSKQTVHSAVSALEKQGLVKLELMEGSKKNKKICLTEEGTLLSENTVKKLYEAEMKVTGEMTADRVDQLNALVVEFYEGLGNELTDLGIL